MEPGGAVNGSVDTSSTSQPASALLQTSTGLKYLALNTEAPLDLKIYSIELNAVQAGFIHIEVLSGIRNCLTGDEIDVFC